MATTIKLKNSVTTTNTPTSLAQGEVAINITDKKVWVGNAATTPIQLLGDGGSASFTSLSLSGNLTFTGTGNRILGDFSNGTQSNRVMFQTSTSNGASVIGVLPNGTGTTSVFRAFNNSDPTNAGEISLFASSSSMSVISGITGTGTYQPLTFLTGGSERLRIDTSGNVSQSAGSYFLVNGGGFGWGTLSTYMGGTSASNFINFVTNNSERMRIDSSGYILAGTTSNASISNSGYSGGAVFAGSTSAGLIIQGNRTADGSLGGLEWYNGSSTRMALIEGRRSGANNSSVLDFYSANAGSLVQAMRIDSSGNIGIGTNSPSTLLHLKSATSGAPQLRIEGAGADNGIITWLGGGHANPAVAIRYISTGDSVGNLAFYANGASSSTLSERMRINSAGNVGIGTSSPTYRLDVNSGSTQSVGRFSAAVASTTQNNGGALLRIQNTDSTNGNMQSLAFTNSNDTSVAVIFAYNANHSTNEGFLTFGTRDSGGTFGERMRITSGGELLVGKTALDFGTVGFRVDSDGGCLITRNGSAALAINRLTNDGDLVEFFQATTKEGSISVSGTTVSYNGGHLSRWSQLPNNQKDNTLLKGTVMSNLDNMCVWTKDGEQLPNEQLNKMKVSDVEGDTNVAGVFVDWQYDEQCQSDDMNVAMTGDMIIRIAQGVVVQKGELLMSAGDGTAKPQGDDIRRSKTVAKVTSNHVTCTYADGSYCVPCVLMAC